MPRRLCSLRPLSQATGPHTAIRRRGSLFIPVAAAGRDCVASNVAAGDLRETPAPRAAERGTAIAMVKDAERERLRQ